MVATQKAVKLKGTASFNGVLQWLQHAGTLYTYNGVKCFLGHAVYNYCTEHTVFAYTGTELQRTG